MEVPNPIKKSMSEKLKAADLFSGCGGLTTGLKKAGFDVVGAIENDSLAVETYKKNHPKVQLWDKDIQKVTAKEFAAKLNLQKGELDLLAGCPPCEGFSRIRTLNGGKEIDDDRNELMFEFLRFVRVLRPKAIMLENVPALAGDYRMEKFLKVLNGLGYEAGLQILDAQDYGVPQRRKRMILLAGIKGEIPFAKKAKRKHTVRETIKGLSKHGSSGDELHDFPERRSKEIMTIIKMIPKDGGSRRLLGEEYQLECHKRSRGFKDIYGRMKWDDVAPTITGGCFNPSKGRFLHPSENRAITLREAALLQGFPKNYYFSLANGKTRAASMIGDALPPQFVRVHAKKVLEYLVASE